MSERILCIDDDPHVLEGYQRALNRRFHIETAQSGNEDLRAVVLRA